ncbi:MAG: hypothetical protein M3Z64_04865 [Verrucomicrobiota bacterium]|nr:hypothetical protein [Verrucomicrobiota bacterium]
MALHLNLLHEELLEQRQRQRDPLKIGTLVLCSLAALMFGYYMFKAYQTLEIKGQLNAARRDWAKVEPKVTDAQKRSAELTHIISTTKVLDSMIDGRFFWGPFLDKVSRCVAPNAQLTNLDGVVLEDNKGVLITIEGLAAGREPREAAEDLRKMLIDQLGKTYKEAKVEFKTLEDLDTLANVAGSNMPTARFILSVDFNPFPDGPKAAAPARARVPKNEAKAE